MQLDATPIAQPLLSLRNDFSLSFANPCNFFPRFPGLVEEKDVLHDIRPGYRCLAGSAAQAVG
jgi:hypothetical protein